MDRFDWLYLLANLREAVIGYDFYDTYSYFLDLESASSVYRFVELRSKDALTRQEIVTVTFAIQHSTALLETYESNEVAAFRTPLHVRFAFEALDIAISILASRQKVEAGSPMGTTVDSVNQSEGSHAWKQLRWQVYFLALRSPAYWDFECEGAVLRQIWTEPERRLLDAALKLQGHSPGFSVREIAALGTLRADIEAAYARSPRKYDEGSNAAILGWLGGHEAEAHLAALAELRAAIRDEGLPDEDFNLEPIGVGSAEAIDLYLRFPNTALSDDRGAAQIPVEE